MADAQRFHSVPTHSSSACPQRWQLWPFQLLSSSATIVPIIAPDAGPRRLGSARADTLLGLFRLGWLSSLTRLVSSATSLLTLVNTPRDSKARAISSWWLSCSLLLIMTIRAIGADGSEPAQGCSGSARLVLNASMIEPVPACDITRSQYLVKLAVSWPSNWMHLMHRELFEQPCPTYSSSNVCPVPGSWDSLETWTKLSSCWIKSATRRIPSSPCPYWSTRRSYPRSSNSFKKDWSKHATINPSNVTVAPVVTSTCFIALSFSRGDNGMLNWTILLYNHLLKVQPIVYPCQYKLTHKQHVIQTHHVDFWYQRKKQKERQSRD